MSMTREEAITNLEKLAALFYTESEQSKMVDYSKIIETLEFAAAALRPITREQVEKMRGEWIIEDACDGDRRKKCSLCNQPISGWWGRDRFCANCGSPMTDEAVETIMKEPFQYSCPYANTTQEEAQP